MRSKFDQQLATLNQELIQMGAMCQQAIALAARALTTGQIDLIEQVDALEAEIDQMERDIETLCLKLLLQQQPVARDLRQVSAALKMITDMERIGDQAADIADILPFLQGRTGEECQPIHLMAQATIRMVTESVNAYVRQDLDTAQAVIDHDDVVDDYFDQVKSALIELIAQEKEKGEYALDLFLIAKYFERIGDHATNIAEWVKFSVTGIHCGMEEGEPPQAASGQPQV